MRKLALVIGLILVGCGGGGETKTTWHASMMNDFLASCESGAPNYYCVCMLDKIMSNYTEEQYIEMLKNDKLPPEIVGWAKECS